MSSPQPQPIDDIAGMRAVPWAWGGSAPRAVKVVLRRGALDLMPLLCRNRQERRCSPPDVMTKGCAASGKWTAAGEAHSLCGCLPCGFAKPKSARSHPTSSLVDHLSLWSTSDQSSCVASKGAKPFKPGHSSLQGPRGNWIRAERT